jgi:hypothetical protein
MPRLRKTAPKTTRNRVVAKPYETKAKANIYRGKLTKVTLPALTCLTKPCLGVGAIDFGAKDWRPQGQEA